VKIDISLIRSQKGASLPVAFSAELEDLSDKGDVVRFKQPVRVTGSLANVDGCFVFTGKVEAKVELICDRCLEPFDLPVSSEMQYLFAEAGSSRGRLPRFARENRFEDELDVREFVDDEIDLTDEVRESVLLALPSKRLCSLECRGICPVCGVNRNVAVCKCTEESIDPRFEKLAALSAHMSRGETVGKSKR